MTMTGMKKNNSTKQNLRIYVFSFNRGRFLENCIGSLERCAPSRPITIIDDGSTDQETLEILHRLAERHCVCEPRAETGDSEFKTGGLTSNMNYAIDDAVSRGTRYALFIQDDMQIVREVNERDINQFDMYFLSNERSIQLHTCFMKLKYRESDDKDTIIDRSRTAYIRNSDATGNVYFSDVGVFNVERVRNLFGRFLLSRGTMISEEMNNDRARKLKIYMGIYGWPFMHWLPFPSSHRGKKRTFSHRLMEHLGGAGLHPIDYMSKETKDLLFSRNLDLRPYAEEYLRSETAPDVPYWSTQGGRSNTNRRGGWRRFSGRMICRWQKVRRK